MLESTKELLNNLNITSANASICTGTQWLTSTNTQTKKVYSPVDGAQLGEVIYASEGDI